MRCSEAQASIDTRKVGVDDEVHEKYREKVSKGLKTKLPRFIRDAFEEYILSDEYSPGCNEFKIRDYDHEILSGIRSKRSKKQ